MSARMLINGIQERVRPVGARGALNQMVRIFAPSPLDLMPEAAPLLGELQQSGYAFLSPLASEADLRRFRSDLEELPCFDPWRPETPDFAFENTPLSANNARIRGVDQLPMARQLANHPLALSVGSHYLGCRPTIDDIVAWWSLPGRPAPKEEQFFHRDNDAVRFVKLFVYLSDVGENGGAHEFVEGSHVENKLLARRVRFKDEEVVAAFGSQRIKRMTGGFGTAFLEDTFGLHKGSVPAVAPRLLFQVRYTSYPSNFARRSSVWDRTGPYDPYVNRLVT